jgi:hypothetical protein
MEYMRILQIWGGRMQYILGLENNEISFKDLGTVTDLARYCYNKKILVFFK